MAVEVMKVIDAVEALNAFNGIEGKATIDMSWAIDDIKEVLEKFSKRFNDEKVKLLERVGESTDVTLPNGQKRYIVKKENLEEYNTEIQKLCDFEVEVTFSPLDYDVVMAQNLGIDVSLARSLRRFIVKKRAKEISPDSKKKKFKDRVVEAAKKAGEKKLKEESSSE